MKTEKFYVAGVRHYEDNILSLGCENEEYNLSNRDLIDSFMEGEKIFEYDFFPKEVDLIPEPENKYDDNAVRVEVDGVLVGYIKMGSCSRVKNLMASPDFRGVRVESMGMGKYKSIWEDDDGKLHVEKGEKSPWVHIEILTESEAERQELMRKKQKQLEAERKKAEAEKQKAKKMGFMYFILGIILYVLSLL